jgi:hypothetical protein
VIGFDDSSTIKSKLKEKFLKGGEKSWDNYVILYTLQYDLYFQSVLKEFLLSSTEKL